MSVGITLALKGFFSAQQTNEWLMQKYVISAEADLLAKLYDNCHKDLYHFLLVNANPELAAEISQRTWLRVIEKKHLYQTDGRFIAWLFTLGRNQLIDEYRRNAKWQTADFDIDTLVAEDDIQDKVQDTLGMLLIELPFAQREAFSLQQEGFGLQEISGITHAPIETVKSRLRYARQSLRKALENSYE
jgi:RNA polymerase sigma-70 factor (ECF subfamily)